MESYREPDGTSQSLLLYQAHELSLGSPLPEQTVPFPAQSQMPIGFCREPLKAALVGKSKI